MPILSIFVILLLAIFATVSYFAEPSENDRKIRERLIALDRHAVAERPEEDDILKRITFSSIALLDQYLRRNALAVRVQTLLEQANVEWTVGRLFFISVCIVIACALVGNWWIGPGGMSWVVALALGTVPLLWLMRKRSTRMRKFGVQLPEAIDLISRALKAGHALSATIEIVAVEIPDPLGPEFRRAADELNYGLPFREALLNLGRRVPLSDLRFLITAVMVQKETGGNLAEILDKSSNVLRARMNLQAKVRVYSAQGRLTGIILTTLPLICFVAISFLDPRYTRLLIEDEFGRRLVYAALAGVVVGSMFIQRIVRIKV